MEGNIKINNLINKESIILRYNPDLFEMWNKQEELVISNKNSIIKSNIIIIINVNNIKKG